MKKTITKNSKGLSTKEALAFLNQHGIEITRQGLYFIIDKIGYKEDSHFFFSLKKLEKYVLDTDTNGWMSIKEISKEYKLTKYRIYTDILKGLLEVEYNSRNRSYHAKKENVKRYVRRYREND
jgi:thermostable 8-oxoguanine DNA glycosylase